MMYQYGEPRLNEADSGKPKNSEKNCPSATFSTTNPTKNEEIKSSTFVSLVII
jgi:hypothetical protein